MGDSAVGYRDDQTSRLFQDADKLLKLAEELEEKCEANSKRLMRLQFSGILLTVALISMGWTTYMGTGFAKSTETTIFVAVSAGFAPAFVFFGYMNINNIRKSIKRDSRALNKIVDMLRDLPLSVQEGVSTLEIAEFRIRLSRFDIGPGSS